MGPVLGGDRGTSPPHFFCTNITIWLLVSRIKVNMSPLHFEMKRGPWVSQFEVLCGNNLIAQDQSKRRPSGRVVNEGLMDFN